MNETIYRMLERQALWQQSRSADTWSDKLRRALLLRETTRLMRPHRMMAGHMLGKDAARKNREEKP